MTYSQTWYRFFLFLQGLTKAKDTELLYSLMDEAVSYLSATQGPPSGLALLLACIIIL